MSNAAKDRPYDIVVWGATGFTGRLVAQYLARTAPADMRLALGGRNKGKLEEIRGTLGGRAVDLLVHDATSLASMRELAKSTKVVCTTVGPYAQHGKPLGEACAVEGTDYCDLTGEPQFIRWSIDELDARAKSTKARIVHTCGFDSIPSDLGVLAVADALDGPLGEVRFVLTDSRGGLSGGTVASALGIFDAAKTDATTRKVLRNPYSLDPDWGEGASRPKRRTPLVSWDRDVGSFVAPFPMAVVNERVVRRSNALMGNRYGDGFDYHETMIVNRALKGLPGAIGITAGLGLFVAAASVGPTRKLLEKKIPKPGEGPSERSRAKGFFKASVFASRHGESRVAAVAKIHGPGDPGYNETAKMMGEAAMCLARDPRSADFPGGVLTPSTAMGTQLTERLRRAGMTFEVELRGAD